MLSYPRHVYLNAPPRLFPPINNLSLHQSHTNATAPGLVTVQHYLLVRGLLRQLPVLYTGPVYQGMALNRQVQYTGPVCRRMVPNQHLHNQYWPARSGPSRKRRRKGPAKRSIHLIYESSGAVSHWRQSGNVTERRQQQPKKRRAMENPSKNPLMADCNLTLAKKKTYNRPYNVRPVSTL